MLWTGNICLTDCHKIIAVYHRLNDNEDKWIVSLSGETIQTEDILEAISFQEQYFMGELYTL